MAVLMIDAPHFCAGVVIGSDGRCAHVAPIIKYMHGWTRRCVEQYAAQKQWTVVDVTRGARDGE